MRLAACLVFLAGGATAQGCPTAADLEDGVRLTRIEPFFSIVMTKTPDGLAEARVMQQNGQPEAVSSTYAHPLTVSGRIASNSNLTVTYQNDTAALQALPALREWSTEVELFSQGASIGTGTYSVSLTGFGEARIDECSYAVWRVRDEMVLDGRAPIIFEKSYAPDLGLIVGSIQIGPDGTPTGSVFFDEITAE